MDRSTPAILLDLDGTLIDSRPGILSSCRVALVALGHAPSPSLDLSGMIGPPIEEIMQSLLAAYGDDRVPEAVAAYRADYGRSGLYGSMLYPGVPEALAELRQAGARLFLATSKRTRFALRILEHLELAEMFEAIHGSEDDGTLDHKPSLIAHILERHALSVARCVMVGDRRHGIIGARANDMRSLGALWGFGTRAELESAGATALVEELTDLSAAALQQVAAPRS